LILEFNNNKISVQFQIEGLAGYCGYCYTIPGNAICLVEVLRSRGVLFIAAKVEN
jgi:hypothetical protein